MNNLPEGHPVKVYLEENILIRQIFDKLFETSIESDYELFFSLFNQLCLVEKHYARKENQLFPYLEKHGWTSPSQNMWAFHDDIRAEIKQIRKDIEANNLSKIEQQIRRLYQGMIHLIQAEEQRLLPNAMQMLSEDEWKEFKHGDAEIGWMLDTPPAPYPTEEYVHPSIDKQPRKLSFDIEGTVRLNEGYLTAGQLNLLFQYLPIDITYVDENDKVIFYNRGEERVFPRSAGIIGREVKFCHPPKSVDMVLKILEEFKKGTKDIAEFWLNFRGRMVHIRYFALRDSNNNYKGVLEMSQDITDVQKIQGEKRLLEWD
jgi:hypothetical protein